MKKNIGIAFIPVVLVLVIISSCSTSQPEKVTALEEVPAWAADAVWYQVFVERFYNGDTTNDPTPETISMPGMNRFAPVGWAITPWTSDWNEREPWARDLPGNLNDVRYQRRYGGDLQGVINKLDYLQDLGINAIFLNPINDAPSLHKYDARNYHHVDVNFGPDPAGDMKLMETENPADPATWKWTSADKLFLQLVAECKSRGMKIIMDYSWNHTGTSFWAWKDVLKNQQNSPYKDWFEITAFDDPSTTANEFAYKGWAGVPDLPELKKVDIKGTRESGLPYEGNIHGGPKAHIMAVAKRWLAPDGDTSKGINGFRLDVADQIGLAFWRDFRKEVRSVQPDAYLVGEIWWEKWPDRLMDPVPYTGGDIFDAVMFYQAFRPARYFFAASDFAIDAKQLVDSLNVQWNRLRPEVRYAMMNVNASHDAPRLLTSFTNRNKYKYHANVYEDSAYNAGTPSAQAYQRVKLYLLHQFTSVGAPHIWNGDEMGMWGADDPDCRKPLWWPEFTFVLETKLPVSNPPSKEQVSFNAPHYAWYKKLATLRHQYPQLRHGPLQFFLSEGNLLGYSRGEGKDQLFVVFNMGDTTASITIPDAKGQLTDLLTGQSYNSSGITLSPVSAMLLTRK